MEAAPTALEGLQYLLKESNLLHLRSAARRFVSDAGLDADFAGFDCVKPHSCTYPMMPLRRSVAHGLVNALRANASQSALTVKLHTSFEKLRNAAMPAGESDADAFAASARTVAEAQRAVQRAERTSTVHLALGGNNCLKPSFFGRLQALARVKIRVFIFEPNPKWAAACGEAARKLDGVFMPAAAWTSNGTLAFTDETDLNGEGDSLFSETIYSTQARGSVTRIEVPTVDLAAWMAEAFPPETRFSMRMDIEGAEYAVMRRLLVTGQACRLASLVFEAHALYSDAHAKFRAFEVLLPWLLHDCPTPVAVEVERYYATLGSAVWSPWGWKSMGPYQRQIRWKPGWCRSCPLLDEIVAPDTT